ncbi:hypothetical protein F5888DRAFT_1716712, partial [Russula emetica]
MIAPAVRSPLLFFAWRQSYPLTPTQSPHGPHRTNSAFYASTRSDRPSSCRRFAMRKHGAGACATCFTCSKSSRNSQSNWARPC